MSSAGGSRKPWSRNLEPASNISFGSIVQGLWVNKGKCCPRVAASPYRPISPITQLSPWLTKKTRYLKRCVVQQWYTITYLNYSGRRLWSIRGKPACRPGTPAGICQRASFCPRRCPPRFSCYPRSRRRRWRERSPWSPLHFNSADFKIALKLLKNCPKTLLNKMKTY